MFSTKIKEDKFINKYYILAFFIFLGLIIRYLVKDFISNDVIYYYLPWFETIKNNGGLLGLGKQVGDYNIIYQSIVAIFTYIPIKPLYQYKLLSIIFDLFLSLEVAKTVYSLMKNVNKTVIAFCITFCLPTVIMDSAMWSQCDSIYVFFLVLCLRLLFEKKYTYSSIAWGFALAFKLQSIFIAPFLFIYFLKNGELIKGIKFLFLAILVFFLSCLPAFLCGRNLLDPVKIYFSQVSHSKKMSMNIANFWSIFNIDDYDKYHMIAIALTFAILIVIMILYKTNDASDIEIAAIICWTVVLFLPAMHDRYMYLAEILFIICFFYKKIYIKIFLVQEVTSIITYINYLFQLDMHIYIYIYILIFGSMFFMAINRVSCFN